MAKRVLIIGGYGNFGSYIAKHLSNEKNIQLIIAGRSIEKAQAFCDALSFTIKPEAIAIDISLGFAKSLAHIKPDIVIHTSGPFQGQDHFVAEACIEYGCHYIDLSDARDFVCEIESLDDKAKKQQVLIVSGASSVPCLSSSIIDHFVEEFSCLEEVNYAITSAQKTNRGLATTQAILSYAGKPFKTIINGIMTDIYGWQDINQKNFLGLGKRYLGNCDIPDLGLFPKHYPEIKTIRFQAGLELPFLHIGLWGLTWLKKVHLLPSLDKFASLLLKTSFLFDRFGSDKSAFKMLLKGKNSKGMEKMISFDLLAKSGDGPYIPCMPAILLAKKLADDEIKSNGARPCIGLITLDEYLKALSTLDISWTTKKSV